MEAKQSSKRQAAKLLQIPRSTLQYWEQRKSELGSLTSRSAFFESKEGLEFFTPPYNFIAICHGSVGRLWLEIGKIGS